jgi:hypothetical protein
MLIKIIMLVVDTKEQKPYVANYILIKEPQSNIACWSYRSDRWHSPTFFISKIVHLNKLQLADFGKITTAEVTLRYIIDLV